MNDADHVFSVSFADPAECLAVLEQARFEFECLLDYMAHHFAETLPPEFIDESIDALIDVADKFGFPTMRG